MTVDSSENDPLLCSHVEIEPHLWKCPTCGHEARTSAAPRRTCGMRPASNATTQRQPAPIVWPDCRFRGSTIRNQECAPCKAQGHKTIEVCACALHTECTAFATSIHPRIQGCGTCPDRTTARASIEIAPRPRVVYLTPSMFPGGAERWILSMCRYLDANTLGVILTNPDIYHDRIASEIDRHTPVVRLTEKTRPTATRLLLEADVVIVWGLGDLSTFLPPGLTAKVVWVAHSACPLTGQLATAAAPHVTHWAGVAEMSRRSMPPDLSPRMTVVHNGIEIERCVPIMGRTAQREQWGVSDTDAVVCYVGRLSKEKNVPALFRALKHLPENYVGVIAGTGLHEDEIRAACEHLAPGRRIIWTGYVQHVGDILAGADVWFNASPAEGCCLSLLEAWAAGIPTVSTPVGALPEMEVTTKQTLAWKVDIDADGPDLASEIQWAFTLGRNSPITQNAKQLAWNYLTAPAMVHRWKTYLDGILYPISE